jgi:hypothetical protein
VKRAAKTKAAKTAEKPIDPRVQRIFDILDAAWDQIPLESTSETSTFDTLVEALVERFYGSTADLDGAKRTVAALAAGAKSADIGACLKLAESVHARNCACCREKTRAA